MWATVRKQGMDPDKPHAFKIWVPRSPEDVEEMGRRLVDDE